MRNAKSTTPTTKRSGKEDGGAAGEKSSGKKLKQARLPFKILAPAAPTATTTGEPSSGTIAATPTAEQKEAETAVGVAAPRKRKLSYEAEVVDEEEAVGGGEDQLTRTRSASKENLVAAAATAAATKKKKIMLSEGDSADVVDDDDDVVLLDDDVVLLNEDDAEAEEQKAAATESKKTKTKGAGTPQSASCSSSSKGKGNSGSASKLQIKLPLLASKKNKRRKSMRKSITSADKERAVADEEDDEEVSADDLELLAGELNPQKRPKVEIVAKKVQKIAAEEKEKVRKEVVETIDLASDNDLDATADKSSTANVFIATESDSAAKESIKQKTASVDKEPPAAKSSTPTKASQESDAAKPSTERVDVAPPPPPLTDIEADDEAEADDCAGAIDDDKNASNHSTSSGGSVQLVQDTTDNELPSSANAKADDEGDEAATIKVPQTPSGAIAAAEQKKSLTPKQAKLHEQRRKAREEKERKLQEERLHKQREKEDKEQARKREREEKEDLRRKEREERDEQKRKERDDKERQRLAEAEAKNEEKRKRNEAKEEELRKKEEELRKKEEERKRKEQEKENAEAKKKKAAEAFTKFFVAKKGAKAGGAGTSYGGGEQNAASFEQESGGGVGGAGGVENSAPVILAFRPFQVKGDMQMAPICRKVISGAARTVLDNFVRTLHGSGDEEQVVAVVRTKPPMYLGELSSGKATPVKWQRPTNDAKANNGDDDVLIIEDELERAGQAIVEETHLPVERLRAKFYKFHENRRPPFFGTWRKKTSLITARRPLAQDKKYFDYEIDSDLEWEEEEPGESLDGSDDDREKESGDDDDYEVDNEWFVPHGHLSDEELEQQNEEECGGGGSAGADDGGGGGGSTGGMGDGNTREAQKAKLKLLQQEFAQEMKKKTEKIKPRLVGCIWADSRGHQPELCPNIIWETLQLRAMLPPAAPPLVEEPEPEKTETDSPGGSGVGSNGALERTTDKLKPLLLTERMQQDLIRLVHGNRHSKVFLIKEFIAYIEANEATIRNGEARVPLKSTVREKIDEFAVWKSTEAATVNIGGGGDGSATGGASGRKKNKLKKRLCWTVAAETLQRLDLQALDLYNNRWEYTLPPKFSATDSAPANATEKEASEAIVDSSCAAATDERVQELVSSPPAETEPKGKRNLEITKFTKVLTAAEKAALLLSPLVKVATRTTKTREAAAAPTAATAPAEVKSPAAAVKKRVPLLMSVARGQQISTSAKNALISQFLKKNTTAGTTTMSRDSEKSAPPAPATTPMETDVIVLE